MDEHKKLKSKFEQYSEEEIKKWFSDLIRGMDEREFWEWVKSWKSADELCKEAEKKFSYYIKYSTLKEFGIVG